MNDQEQVLRDDLINEHLPYELCQMRYALQRLVASDFSDQRLKNVMVAAFWLHARNLIEFFTGTKKRCAFDFTEQRTYAAQHLPRGRTRKKLLQHINGQITHLIFDRVTKEKLDVEVFDVYEKLEAEFQSFKSSLPDRYAALLPPGL